MTSSNIRVASERSESAFTHQLDILVRSFVIYFVNNNHLTISKLTTSLNEYIIEAAFVIKVFQNSNHQWIIVEINAEVVKTMRAITVSYLDFITSQAFNRNTRNSAFVELISFSNQWTVDRIKLRAIIIKFHQIIINYRSIFLFIISKNSPFNDSFSFINDTSSRRYFHSFASRFKSRFLRNLDDFSMSEHKQSTLFIDKSITFSFNESDIIWHSLIETFVEKIIYDHFIKFHQTFSLSLNVMNDQFIEI